MNALGCPIHPVTGKAPNWEWRPGLCFSLPVRHGNYWPCHRVWFCLDFREHLRICVDPATVAYSACLAIKVRWLAKREISRATEVTSQPVRQTSVAPESLGLRTILPASFKPCFLAVFSWKRFQWSASYQSVSSICKALCSAKRWEATGKLPAKSPTGMGMCDRYQQSVQLP